MKPRCEESEEWSGKLKMRLDKLLLAKLGVRGLKRLKPRGAIAFHPLSTFGCIDLCRSYFIEIHRLTLWTELPDVSGTPSTVSLSV